MKTAVPTMDPVCELIRALFGPYFRAQFPVNRQSRERWATSSCLSIIWPCTWVLYGHARGFVSQAMKDYGQNSSICRRTLLCESFLFSDVSSYVKPKKCECCDLCFSICQCDQCIKI